MKQRFTSHRLRAASHRAPDPEVSSRGSAPVIGVAEDGDKAAAGQTSEADKPKEIGGPSGPEPTRYGDWERNGICYDF